MQNEIFFYNEKPEASHPMTDVFCLFGTLRKGLIPSLSINPFVKTFPFSSFFPFCLFDCPCAYLCVCVCVSEENGQNIGKMCNLVCAAVFPMYYNIHTHHTICRDSPFSFLLLFLSSSMSFFQCHSLEICVWKCGCFDIFFSAVSLCLSVSDFLLEVLIWIEYVLNVWRDVCWMCLIFKWKGIECVLSGLKHLMSWFIVSNTGESNKDIFG